MGKKEHKVLDHPILGYFLLAVFASVLMSLGSQLDVLLGGSIPGYVSEISAGGKTMQHASGIGAAAGALAALGIFKFWFRPDFKGCLQTERLLTEIILLSPVLLVHYAGSIVSWITLGTGSVLLAFLKAFAPGFGEEIMFRGMGVANYMRTIRSEQQIKVIFWLSSIVFGLVHATNIFAGGDPFAVAVQTVYAIGIGMALGAVYLRTGNLLPCIIGHMSLDFMEFVRSDLSASSGIMTGMGAGDWITVAAAVIGAVWSLRLIRPEYYSEIMEIWNDKWNKNDPTW